MKCSAFSSLLVLLPLAYAWEEQSVLASTTTPSLKLYIQTPSSLVSHTALATAVSQVLNSGQVRDVLAAEADEVLNGKPSHRLLHVDNLREPNEKYERNSFRAVVADYENGRTVYVNVDDALGPLSEASVEITNHQPLPNEEELLDAASIAGFGPNATVFSRMPVIVHETNPDGSTPRILRIEAGNSSKEVLRLFDVNMYTRTATPVQRPQALQSCQAVWENKSVQGVKGKVLEAAGRTAHVKITDSANNALWELDVTRPRSSSGNMGSGVDLTEVRYKNRLVLKQAHLPMLNVNYLEVVKDCGPTFRDWQNEEYPFDCPGKDTLPGFRECTGGRSKTFVDGRPDAEGFRGVSFDVYDDNVVIRSQLKADWYRYVSQWTLSANGTIAPRWGFGGVNQADLHCVCVKHHHHAFWRLDFDIETSKNNEVRQCDGNKCTAQKFTGRMEKADNRYWDIVNTASNRGYRLTPGKTDRKASDPEDTSKYFVGDLWLVKADALRDDGCTTIRGQWPPESTDCTQANFNAIKMSQEESSVQHQDQVLWYSASYMHWQGHEDATGGNHWVGPLLEPIGTW
ncbi:uncharacterized protein Z520_05459 [Fonsecaea multimorphosa CBS 102226]|uniref:Amine oxidase n=1 Tax=Fonsecaea multimorphosa CBS 102226 TaxID=1442371 RepID=A0A0D2KQM7_9EURO|nr:uncharacterized protein Z520_05459 [Fonsecaea multimorphosa CBS 102226]KIX98998.1 hypothetical protein Z520_05459 [Fonsecaea multimorphosa CBS 102226]OAL25268.1 hypothetical protein AYO22_05145 [Fonsecaea multimorphosa]